MFGRPRLAAGRMAAPLSSLVFTLAWSSILLGTVLGCASRQAAATHTGDHFDAPPRVPAAVRVPPVGLPDASAGRPVSLDAMLAYADRHAPALGVARERVGLGQAAIAGAEPLLPDNPTLSLGAGPRFAQSSTHVDLTASLAQRFEIAGERGLRLEAADRTRRRLVAELAEARWQVHLEVHAAFHRALVARDRLAAAERLREFQERLLEITGSRLRAGDVSPLAVRLAESELAQARVSRIAAGQSYERAKLELAAVAGWPPTTPPEPAGGLDEPRDPPEAERLASVARARQPRLRTLLAASLEATARARAADRDAWPEPTLAVQATREGAPAGLEETAVLGLLSLPIPLFSRNQGARAAAHAETRIVEAERAAFSRELAMRMVMARGAVAAAAARVRSYGGEIVPSFEENLRLLERAFELGEIDILQVSVARERFLLIQTDALDAYAAYFEAVADLEASIGADLWPDERHEHGPGSAEQARTGTEVRLP